MTTQSKLHLYNKKKLSLRFHFMKLKFTEHYCKYGHCYIMGAVYFPHNH